MENIQHIVKNNVSNSIKDEVGSGILAGVYYKGNNITRLQSLLSNYFRVSMIIRDACERNLKFDYTKVSESAMRSISIQIKSINQCII